ncbi:MAG: YiiX/YebB-like N1pC/P60 family cysteine hydrolase [Bacteroidota bacterium]
MSKKSRSRPRFRLLILPLVIILLIGTGLYFLFPRQKTLTYYTDSDQIEFHDGDLILRRGKSFVSQLVLLGDKESQYSHIGIVIIRDNTPYVIHAVPGEAENNEPEYVRMETIPEFLDVSKSADFAVYTLKNKYKGIGNKVAEKAYEYYKEQIQFDSSFNLEDHSRLYCTELVWCAYLSADIKLTGTYDELKIPFYKGDFIYPSNLLNHSIFKKLYPH